MNWIGAFALCALAALAADGVRRKPADPAELLTLRDKQHLSSRVEAAPTLRLATFNIHAGVGRDGKRNLRRTADCLKDLDVIALQEVRVPLLDGFQPQARSISRFLDMAWLFVPTEKRWWHNEYGNAILTTAPLDSFCRIPLPTPERRSFRTALLADVHQQGRVIHLLAAHLDKETHNKDRDRQLRLVCDLFRSLNGPSVLFGDLNSLDDDPEIVRLLKTPGVHDALADAPRTGSRKKMVDWIITKELRTVHAEWRPNVASDHQLARAEVALIDPVNDRRAEAPAVKNRVIPTQLATMELQAPPAIR